MDFVSADRSRGGTQPRFNMETIWLQRSSPDVPWGFRLVGGREFNVPLSVQRVTPGSVAAAGLGPGDLILKVGNVMATNLEHNDAMELVKQAGNILQLTIKKVEGPSPPGPLSPSSYGSQVTAQLSDSSGYSTTPRGFGVGIPISSSTYSNSNASPGYATTPRNYGSQQQGTRIEIQRVNPTPPPQPQRSFSRNYDDEGPSFPDYTIPYKQIEPIHDSPGGPVNIRGYQPPSQQNSSYSSKSLPRGVNSYSNNDRDGLGGAGGPPAYEPRSYNPSQSSFSPVNNSEIRFNTGLSFQSSQAKPPTPTFGGAAQSYNSAPQPFSNVGTSYNKEPQSYTSAPQSFNSAPQSYNSAPKAYSSAPTTTPQVYNSTPRPFSPPSYTGPLSPKVQPTPVGFGFKPASYNAEPASSYNQAPSSYGTAADQSRVHGSGSNTYSTLPHTKPSYNTNNNNSFNIYNSAPQPYSAPKPFSQTQVTFQPKPYQSPLSPNSSYTSNISQPSSQAPVRRVSFDQHVQETGAYSPSTNFSPRPYVSPPPVSVPGYPVPSYDPPEEYSGVSDFGSPPVMQPPSYSRQGSRSNEAYASTSSYVPPVGPTSPRSEVGGYGYTDARGGYDPSGVSAGLDNLNLGSPRTYQAPAPVSPAPPPPPPPPPPSAPPPPPAPPLDGWNPAPYRRQNFQQNNDESEEQKIPDQLLSTMLKSAKGGGPKPFSYGIDLSELKKKMGPPTAPKPRKGQPNYEPDDVQDVSRPGPPRKPAGQIQSDYFLSRDDEDNAPRAPKKPAGYVQGDYFLNRDEGPRAEIDESSLRVNMGTDPKKQSKSFKVLQWMTETEKDDPEDLPKPKRTKDPERRHNAEDDEMRFTGLHSKAEIPSKAFGLLRKISADDTPVSAQNGKDTLDVGDAEDGVGNYDETSIRYKGKNIPSPSFRVLQTWAEHDPDPALKQPGLRREEEEEDGLPETLNNEDMVDKRYKGGNIPSKVFKHLQKTVGEDTSEASAVNGGSAPGGVPQRAAAPVSDF
ncbi:unnamed protein product [Lymnaea stagnalis]|uniref:PDZ domain-containing protein n=1 Tax=Lymnaea stagnalis TaxID=6523 RepID=A0AAV2HJM4_LYMST